MLSCSVFANQDTCGDIIQVNDVCIAITPPIGCDTYRLYNSSGGLLEYENMSALNSSIYYFNFSQPKVGEYIVVLCDNSTSREFVVGVENKSVYYLLIVGIIFVLIILSHYLSDPVLGMFAGILSCVFAIYIYSYGLADLQNQFLVDGLSVGFLGLGFFYLIAPWLVSKFWTGDTE